MTDYFY